ncbi:hypothetical protein ES703_118257 [subsurface metagenome]
MEFISDVFPVGNYLYAFSQFADDLLVFDGLAAGSLNLIAQLSIGAGGNISGIWVRGRYLYATKNSAPYQLLVIDVSDPANPVQVGFYENATILAGADGIAVVANTAFVAGVNYLASINISDPTNPTLISSVPWGENGAQTHLKVVGKYAYTTHYNYDKVRITDISDPANMSIVGTLEDAIYLNGAADLDIAGDWIFAVGKLCNYLTIIDARVKTAPVRHESFNLGTNGAAIVLAGKYAFVGGHTTQKFCVVQLWSLEIPALLGNVIWADQIYAYRATIFEQVETQRVLADGVSIPDGLPKTLSYTLLSTQVVSSAPGTAYIELSALYRTNIDFSRLAVKRARVIVSAIGNEAGAGKGIEIYNSSDAAAICAATWDGSAQQNGLAGSWTVCSLRAAKDIQVRVKGSSATEDITVDRVELQLMFE